MKKKNIALYIDGENIPAKSSAQIFMCVRNMGVLDYAKVYGIQKDKSTYAWSKCALEIEELKDIRLYGGPGKNKVDNKIQRDVKKEISNHKNIDIVVIVTSDHGYATSIRDMRSKGKRVVVIGNHNMSEKLKKSCSKYYCLENDR